MNIKKDIEKTTYGKRKKERKKDIFGQSAKYCQGLEFEFLLMQRLR